MEHRLPEIKEGSVEYYLSATDRADYYKEGYRAAKAQATAEAETALVGLRMREFAFQDMILQGAITSNEKFAKAFRDVYKRDFVDESELVSFVKTLLDRQTLLMSLVTP